MSARVSGPYHYEGDLHPSFRIDNDDRVLASVYASDGNIEAAQAIAERVAKALDPEARILAPGELDACTFEFAAVTAGGLDLMEDDPEAVLRTLGGER